MLERLRRSVVGPLVEAVAMPIELVVDVLADEAPEQTPKAPEEDR